MSTYFRQAAVGVAVALCAAPACAEGELPSPLTLADVLSAVRSKNPAIGQHRDQARAALARRRGEGLPDDPMLMLEWGEQPGVLSADNERLGLLRAHDEAAARLNVLLDRPPGAALGPTATLATLVKLPSESELVERALARRPEVVRARDLVAAAESRVAL